MLGFELTDQIWDGADSVSRFALGLDSREPARIAAAFAPHGYVDTPDGKRQNGPEEIRAYYEDRFGTTGSGMHVLNRLSTWRDDEGLEHALCYALIVLGPGAGESVTRLITGSYEFVIDPAANGIVRLEVRLDDTFELTKAPPLGMRSEGNG
jgi:hypothetical protein